MKIKNPYDKSIEYEVTPIRTEYMNEGNLAISLECEDGEPYGMLTVNLRGKLPEDMAYVDTNNIPDAEKFISENGLGTNTGITMVSGFCIYPLYRFNLDKLERR